MVIITRRTAAPALVLALTYGVACSSDGDPSDGGGGKGGAGTSAGSGGGSGVGGSGAATGGSSGSSGTSSGGSGAATAGGTGGAAGVAGVGGAGASPGGTGGSGGAPSGGAAGGGNTGGTGGSNEACAAIASEYASSLAQQITCSTGAGNQCQDLVEAAPGCDCRVFIEPKDPFAIEHLANLYADWLDADCENPTCPSSCPSGARGSCGSNGRCTASP